MSGTNLVVARQTISVAVLRSSWGLRRRYIPVVVLDRVLVPNGAVRRMTSCDRRLGMTGTRRNKTGGSSNLLPRYRQLVVDVLLEELRMKLLPDGTPKRPDTIPRRIRR